MFDIETHVAHRYHMSTMRQCLGYNPQQLGEKKKWRISKKIFCTSRCNGKYILIFYFHKYK